MKAIKTSEEPKKNETKDDYIVKPPQSNPAKDADKVLNMKESYIWNGFPFWERFLFTALCGSGCLRDNNKRMFPVEDMLKNKTDLDSKYNSKFQNKCFSIKILKTGPLEIESYIMHPFIVTSIVNIQTSRYIQKKIPDVPCFSVKEKNLIINKNSAEMYEFQENALDYIPPFSTPPYDLREKGESYAEWNEEFIINEDAANIFNPNTVLFFEILDYNFNLPLENCSENGINKIAWGFLKLVGYSQTYLGNHKVQLYRYKYNRPDSYKLFQEKNKIDKRTPEILYEFNWIKKDPYPSYIEIDIRVENRPSVENLTGFMGWRYNKSVFLEEGEDINRETLKRSADRSKKKKFEELDMLANEKRKMLLRRKRGPSEYCILPDKLLFKLKTSKIGCLTIKFSEDGRYLACACSEISSLTSIKIYSMEDGNLKYHLKGHLNLIHDLVWAKNSQILFSASADGSLSIWTIPKEESNSSENLDFMDNDRIFKIHTITHPSYVYSIAIYPQDDKEIYILVTACFDGFIRVYILTLKHIVHHDKFIFEKLELAHQISVYEEKDFQKNPKKKVIPNFNEPEKYTLLDRTVLDHRHPNTLVFDNNGILYVGDSQGAIHKYEVSIRFGKLLCTFISTIVNEKLNGDIINKIYLPPKDNNDKRLLIVHSRDNCIRQLDVNANRITNNYYGSKCSRSNIKSTISPDGQFILSGSELGKPHLWEFCGIDIDTSKYECEFIDSVSDVAWNKQYNMFALSGFGHEYPILVYVFEKDEIKLDPYELKLKKEGELVEIKNAEEMEESKDNQVITNMKDNASEFIKEYKTVFESQLINAGNNQ